MLIRLAAVTNRRSIVQGGDRGGQGDQISWNVV